MCRLIRDHYHLSDHDICVPLILDEKFLINLMVFYMQKHIRTILIKIALLQND